MLNRHRVVYQSQVRTRLVEIKVGVQRLRIAGTVLSRCEDHQELTRFDRYARGKRPLSQIGRVVGQVPSAQIRGCDPGVEDFNPVSNITVLVL